MRGEPSEQAVGAGVSAWHALAAYELGENPNVESWQPELGGEAGLRAELILGGIEHARFYDALCGRFQADLALELRIALRVVAHQLFVLDEIPVTNATHVVVAVLEQVGYAQYGKLAREVAQALVGIRSSERRCAGPVGRIAHAFLPTSDAELYGLPDRLIADIHMARDGCAERSLAALNIRQQLCTRTRPGAPQISGASIRKRDGPWIWWGDPGEAFRGAIADARCEVQDRSAGRLAEAAIAIARAQPGNKVLVLGDETVGAVQILRDAGLVVTQDAKQSDSNSDVEIVAINVASSQTGRLHRYPQARRCYSEASSDTCIASQRSALHAAAARVSPGGRLVYRTDSIIPAENQGVAHALTGWRMLGETTTWPSVWESGGYTAVLLRR